MGKILVTGATGFTGSNLCKRLILDGEQVVAFVRDLQKAKNLVRMGVECRLVDLDNCESIYDHFTGIEKVFHIAAAYRTEHIDLSQFWRVNVEATRYLLKASVASGVKRFVHCSTVGVQGEIEDSPASEDYRFKPGDHYQKSKMEGELLALEYFKKGLPGSVVRPVGIYGPGDTRFLKLFRPISKGHFVMIGTGNSLYHMTYIDDLIDGFLLCGKKKEALGEVFTIAGANYTTLCELVDLIADVLGKSPPRFRIPYYPVFLASILCERICRSLGLSPPLYPRRVEFFVLDRAFSIEKAKRLIGYQPKIGLREGLERTAAWYKKEGLI